MTPSEKFQKIFYPLSNKSNSQFVAVKVPDSVQELLTELGEMTVEQALTDDRPEIRGLAKFIMTAVGGK
jgi:hypothetical protein